jgi:hypothetical protein
MTLGYEAAREAAMAAFAKELATAIAPRCPWLSTHTQAASRRADVRWSSAQARQHGP